MKYQIYQILNLMIQCLMIYYNLNMKIIIQSLFLFSKYRKVTLFLILFFINEYIITIKIAHESNRVGEISRS